MEDVIVVGAGASGLVAAIVCAREGRSVTLLEHNDKIGRKLLATGNGKCNFTNDLQRETDYRSENPSFAFDLIKQYDKKAYLTFLESIGIYPKNKNGYYYPYSEQATAMVNALRLELERLKVKIKLREHVTEIVPFFKDTDRNVYKVNTNTYTYESEKIIISCGGKALKSLGADGSGYSIAEGLGHTITPLTPALTGLKIAENYKQILAGIRCHAELVLEVNKKAVAEEIGEIQFTAYGISGIPVFQVSRFAGRALYDKKEVFATLRLLPDLSTQKIIAFLSHQKELFPEKMLVQTLESFMDIKMAEVMCARSHLKKVILLKSLQEKDMEALVCDIKSWKMKIIETNTFEQAQVTAGGVSTFEVERSSMESKKQKGIYFTGELLDVDGTCGGYNLQWAFSSAYTAGINASKK